MPTIHTIHTGESGSVSDRRSGCDRTERGQVVSIEVLDASESLICDRGESVRYDRAMKFQLSKHAQERIASRNIPASFVEQLLECPQQVLDEAPNKQIYQSQFQFPNGRTYLLRAIVYSSTRPVIVASIYKTNQIKRYWKAE
jgi:hypothetical protein